MLWTYVSSSCELILLLVLLLIHLSYSQGQKIEDCKRFNGYSCVKFPDCPSGSEIVRNRIATLCGFDNGTRIAKICCPRASAPITPATEAAPVITGSTPITPSRRPTSGPITPWPPTTVSRQADRPIPKNATAIAILNCQKYEKYQYVTKFLEPILTEEEPLPYLELDCDKVDTIVLGGPSDPKEYPHMALIGYGNNFRNVKWACGGSLISEKFVLSAAHCSSSELGQPKWSLLGDLNITSETNRPRNMVMPKVYSIVRVFNHPNYKPPSLYNDIAVFELNATVEMSPFVRPACLHTSTYNRVDSSASITGWGRTGTAERRSNQLLKSIINIQEEDLCASKYSTSSRLDRGFEPSSMICAGDLISGKDTCSGDSGGPLQVKVPNTPCMWSVVGITSTGLGICGDSETPGIYTKVAHFLDWIQGVVWP